MEMTDASTAVPMVCLMRPVAWIYGTGNSSTLHNSSGRYALAINLLDLEPFGFKTLSA
jgi:hypothetical protein